jgi:hypothetical protein
MQCRGCLERCAPEGVGRAARLVVGIGTGCADLWKGGSRCLMRMGCQLAWVYEGEDSPSALFLLDVRSNFLKQLRNRAAMLSCSCCPLT